ncbi:MAG TPA: CusA/CzcA family heavy metal efflux RND transporter [Leptospiraceae bacterium]|nr:CusA/CzcA family heavy metal efflux RND transporter [Leptospiraceae bacterium]HMX35560.1 CusA/CzcA family heavy metal efflux RND transporter [Leptospiraceae bacterium]HMY33756.1 CusA/CzcA family heavy metal efflux RND transporter [Leptospiraceae bacterium]HMZ66878.1 CusA/CzcA family heavy metal efflux RND transporter [Leptospiraceae bacterium]HNA07815.1 CusA/CzcA family heavy metal efflux RND transporter [Leptospiraceae bacterium]
MIEKLIELSIRNKYIVLLLTALVSFIGIISAANLSVDAVPDVTNIQVSAVTVSPGLSPMEVEQFITNPIELSLMGIPGATEIRSISRTGVSSVTVIFEDNVNIWFARQLVSERLKVADKEIPPEYGTPELSPVATALGDIYEFVLKSDRHTPMELRTYIDWELSKKIKSIPGVIEVNSIGGEAKEYQVIIDPRNLVIHNLTLSEIYEDIKSANTNTGGGYIIKGNEQVVIRGEGQFEGIDEINRIAVRTAQDGTPLLLGQIAEVKIGSALRFGIASKNQTEVVAATVIMLLGQNSRTVVSDVKKKMDEIQKTLPEGMIIEPFYDRSEFINRALSTIFINLAEGAILVLLTLIVTLGTFKGGVLVAMAIPISMLCAVIFMKQLGVVGNLMSLGALDFGLLVDGSIVMLESVMAGFIAKKSLFETPMNRFQIAETTESIILENCNRVGRAAAFSVAIIMLVYLPLMVLEGVEGRMFRPMAVTVALALGAALLFSITVFPASIAVIFKEPIFHKSHYWEILERYYKIILHWGFKHKKRIILVSLLLIFLSMLLATTLGSEFIPRIDEGEFEMDVKRLPSTSIEYSKDLNIAIERILSEIPEIKSAVSRVGRGESAAEPAGTEETSIMIKLKDKKEWKNAKTREELMTLIKDKVLQNIPSSYISMSQPIENRINSLLAGSKADVVVKVYGEDLETLKKIGEDLSGIMKEIPGTGDIRVQRVLGLPVVRVNTNYDLMARYGVSSSEILRTVEMLRVGTNAGKIFEGLKRFDLVLRLDLNIIKDIKQINNIPVMSVTGKTIPLGQVADIELIESAASIQREDLKRRLFVEVNIRGRDLVGYIEEAQEKTKIIANNLPSGYEIKWGGQFENFTRAKNRLLLVVPIALGIIFGMLILAFGSIFYALGVFIVVPLATSGGIISLALRDLPFSIPAGVGFIAVSGIAVLNGVVYASALKDKLKEGLPLTEAIYASAIESLRPVMTTEVIAAIGFIPMALSNMAGAEVQRPLATVVIGGVITATALSRLLLPITMEYLLSKSIKIEEKKNKEIAETKSHLIALAYEEEVD